MNQKVGHAHVQPWLVEAHGIGHGKTHCSEHGGSPSFTATAGFSTIHDKAGSMVPDKLVVEIHPDSFRDAQAGESVNTLRCRENMQNRGDARRNGNQAS